MQDFFPYDTTGFIPKATLSQLVYSMNYSNKKILSSMKSYFMSLFAEKYTLIVTNHYQVTI